MNEDDDDWLNTKNTKIINFFEPSSLLYLDLKKYF